MSRVAHWVHVYRVALRLLPEPLKHKHGARMQELFARELEVARTGGWWAVARTGIAGTWDVVWRAVYERQMVTHSASSAESSATASPETAHRSSPMPIPTAGQLLRRLATPFLVSLVLLTGAMIANYGVKLRDRALVGGSVGEALLLAVPFTAAMTIPMAVLIAVLWTFTRLGREGVLDAARFETTRLLRPVLAASAGVAAILLLVTTQVVPRANERLMVVTSGHATPNDRTMTVQELRAAGRNALARGEPGAEARVAAYEVEVQKKFALAAACIVLALAGAALVLRWPRGGAWMAGAAGVVILGVYYVCLIAGETLADRRVLSPFLAMWSANLLLLAFSVTSRRRRTPTSPTI